MATSEATHSDDTLLGDLDDLLRHYYHEELAELAQQYPHDQKSLFIDYNDVFKFEVDLADDLVSKPGDIRSYFEAAVEQFDLPADVDLSGVNVRFYNLPASRQFHVGEYRSEQLTEFVAVEGQISKQTAVKPLPETLVFECQRCGTGNSVPQDSTEVQEPHECQGCERQGPFVIKEEQSDWTDIQRLRLQLPPEYAQGDTSAQIDVDLRDDIVDVAEAGDRVTVSATLQVDDGDSSTVGFTPYLDAHAVAIEDSDYQNIHIDEYLDDIRAVASGEYGDPYQLLVDSIAPTIHGMDEIKEALALQLFGGVRAEYPDGSTDRGEPHVLLLGDPGTAKSSLLEDIHDKAPCSTYASGMGATAAGMTASAVADDFGPNEYSLEAGAMVLADNGVACIDEIDKVKEDAVASLHDALSQQQVHINKAGINTHLHTRTSLLAAGNPKHGRFVDHQPIAEQIDLGPTILSRFDLLFMLDDSPDQTRDAEIIENMIESRQKATRYTDPNYHAEEGEFDDIKPAVRTPVLRAWVAYAKQNVYPSIEDEAVAAELRDSFKRLRLSNGEDNDSPVPVTFRRLEGYQRLAQASARVRLSETVEQQDIERAKRLIARSMRDVGMDPESKQFDADIVETGRTNTQQKRRTFIEQYIRQHEGVDAVGLAEIIDAAKSTDIGENEAEHAIKKLKAKGIIYEPDAEEYRST